MKGKMLQYYNDLPQWAKGVTVVGGLAVAFLIGNSVVRGIKQRKADKLALAESDAAGRRLVELQRDGIKPTYPDSTYQSWANQIVAAISDCGTDESALFRIFENIRNEADLQKLIQVYGVREFKGCFSAYFAMEKGSLSYALTYELDSSELAKINKIIATKNINYKF